MALVLVKIGSNDKDSFNTFMENWKSLPTMYIDFKFLDSYNGDFDSFLVSLKEEEKKEYPEYYYFLKEDDIIYGFVVIRPKLDEFMANNGGNILYGIAPKFRNHGYGSSCLREGIELARKFGLNEILLTCHKLNVTAARVVINNGGVMEEEVLLENGDRVRKFWIK